MKNARMIPALDLARRSLRLSQARFAAVCGVSQSAISRLERGVGSPAAEALVRAALGRLGVTALSELSLAERVADRLSMSPARVRALDFAAECRARR